MRVRGERLGRSACSPPAAPGALFLQGLACADPAISVLPPSTPRAPPVLAPDPSLKACFIYCEFLAQPV